MQHKKVVTPLLFCLCTMHKQGLSFTLADCVFQLVMCTCRLSSSSRALGLRSRVWRQGLPRRTGRLLALKPMTPGQCHLSYHNTAGLCVLACDNLFTVSRPALQHSAMQQQIWYTWLCIDLAVHSLQCRWLATSCATILRRKVYFVHQYKTCCET